MLYNKSFYFRDLTINNKRLFYNTWGKQGVLYQYNITTDKNIKLFTGGFKSFTVNEKGKVYYCQDSKNDYGSEIWLYDKDKRDTFKLGKVEQNISELSYNQGKLITVCKELMDSWGVYQLDIENMSLNFLLDTQSHERAVFVRDNNIIFSANYDGYQSLYEYNLDTGRVMRLTTKGYGYSGVYSNQKIYYKGIAHDGEALFEITKKPLDFSMPDRDVSKNNLNLESIVIREIPEVRIKKENLLSLLKPYNRFVPELLTGEDILGLNSYNVAYSGKGGLNFYWNSLLMDDDKEFLPISLTISNIKKDNNRETNIMLSSTIYKSDLPGLSDVELNYQTNLDSHIPGIKCQVSYPDQKISFLINNNLSNQGLNSEFSYRYFFDSASLNIKGSLFKEYEKSNNIRGFNLKDEYSGKVNGLQYNIDYTHKLYEVRDGFWNPNIFVADVYGNIFTDYSNLDSSGEHLAYGYECLFEVGMANLIKLVPSIGFSQSDDKTNIFLKLHTNF